MQHHLGGFAQVLVQVVDVHLRLGAHHARLAVSQHLQQRVVGVVQLSAEGCLPCCRHVDHHVLVEAVGLQVLLVMVGVAHGGVAAYGLERASAAPGLSAHGCAVAVGLYAVDVGLAVRVVVVGAAIRGEGRPHEVHLAVELLILGAEARGHGHRGQVVLVVVGLGALVEVLVVLHGLQGVGGHHLRVEAAEVAHGGGDVYVVGGARCLAVVLIRLHQLLAVAAGVGEREVVPGLVLLGVLHVAVVRIVHGHRRYFELQLLRVGALQLPAGHVELVAPHTLLAGYGAEVVDEVGRRLAVVGALKVDVPRLARHRRAPVEVDDGLRVFPPVLLGDGVAGAVPADALVVVVHQDGDGAAQVVAGRDVVGVAIVVALVVAVDVQQVERRAGASVARVCLHAAVLDEPVVAVHEVGHENLQPEVVGIFVGHLEITAVVELVGQRPLRHRPCEECQPEQHLPWPRVSCCCFCFHTYIFLCVVLLLNENVLFSSVGILGSDFRATVLDLALVIVVFVI